jgi:hypothetical protein
MKELAGTGPPRLREGEARGEQRKVRVSENREAMARLELGEGEADEAGTAAAPLSQDILLELVRSNQKMVEFFMSDRSPRPDAMQTLLSAGGSLDDDFKGGGAKGCAARNIYQEVTLERHEQVYNVVKKLLAKTLKKPVDGLDSQAMLHYFENYGQFGQLKMLVYTSMLLGHLWAAVEEGDLAKIKGTLARSCMFVDQVCAEGGSHYKLGWLIAGFEEVPWDIVQARASVKRTPTLHSRLVHPQYLTVNLAYLRDMDTIEERTKKSHQEKDC